MYGISRMEPLWQSEDQSINLRWATGSKWTVKRRRKRTREREREKPEGESEPQFIISTSSSRTELYNYPQRDNLFISNSIYLLLTPFLSFVFIKIFIAKSLGAHRSGTWIKPKNLFVIYQSHHVIFCSNFLFQAWCHFWPNTGHSNWEKIQPVNIMIDWVRGALYLFHYSSLSKGDAFKKGLPRRMTLINLTIECLLIGHSFSPALISSIKILSSQTGGDKQNFSPWPHSSCFGQ